jgi:hypothetical protein
MYAKAAFVFWTCLILYIFTLCTVTYVGVYLTYIAIPIIAISGLVMKCSTPTPDQQEVIDSTKSLGKEVNALLGEANHSLRQFNELSQLKRERTSHLVEKVTKLKHECLSIDLNGDCVYGASPQRVKEINTQVGVIEKQIDVIKSACEVEVESKYN